MKNLWILLPLSVLLMQLPPAHASEDAERPSIGLVLSGGGTKAGAHIGVLRVLEENRVPIDYIAGTSAGAIIGGLYASGLSPDEIEAAIADIDWDDMLDDSPARADLPFRRKLDNYNYLVRYSPGIEDGALQHPMGIVHGQEIVRFLRRHLHSNAGARDFDELPIPLRIVAMDLASGEAVVIGEGDLALAVRASMSIPLLFTPVEWNGRRLVDGGPANNLPIDVVRGMGADIVIAVDITAPLLRDDEIDSAIAVADQMTNILTQRSVQDQLAGLTDDDILIRPDLTGIGGLDFSNTLEPIELGEQAAKAARPALSPLALDPSGYRELVSGRERAQHSGTPTIRRVEIRNESSISTDFIRSRLGFGAGDPLDLESVERGIDDVYGLDLFERIDYRIDQSEADADIYVDVVPKSWGPNYLQFGLQLSEDFSQDSDFNIGIAYLQTEVNSLGGEWRAQLDLGDRQGISLEWYQPLGIRSRYFLEAEALLARRSFRFFQQEEAVADIRVEGWGSRLSLGTYVGNSAELRLGWNRFKGAGDTTVGTVDLDDGRAEIGEYFTTLRFDRLDNLNFPREGAAAGIGAYWSRQSAGADVDYDQIAGGVTAAHSWGENSLLASIEGGTTLEDDAPLESQFLLGGLGRLSGFSRDQFAGQHYGLVSVTAFRRLNRSLWAPTYAGISLEAGNVWQDSAEISTGDLRFAGAAFAGVDSPLGPIYLAWGLGEEGNDTVYLYLGNPFVREGARPLD